MDEECNSSEQSFSTVHSGSKIMREKRVSVNSGDKHEAPRKRVKMKDLESLIQFTETGTRKLECINDKENCGQWSCGDKEASQITKVPVTVDMDVSKEEQIRRNTSVGPRNLDLNTDVCGARYSSLEKRGGCNENLSKEPLSEKQERTQCSDVVNRRGINLDLNAEDVTSCVKAEPVTTTHKGHGRSKSKDVSESASCTGPMEEKDPMKIWTEMKRNGFVSSSHGGIPVPKKRGRKSKSELLKQKMEMAKREEVNRFSKIAAPSGLLNDLNPGIINHVRNRKQVHSIIEALVTEKHEKSGMGSKQATRRVNESLEVNKHQPTLLHEEGTFHGSSGSRQARKYPVATNDSSRILEGNVCDRDTYGVVKAGLKRCVSNASHDREDDILALKLTSSMKASTSSTNLSNEGSSDASMVSSLSLKAATVASQWLELLHQDIKGRLAALRRSKRRVRNALTTDLPLLISKEFENNQDCDQDCDPYSTSQIAELHRVRWTALFDHMDEALSEEEVQLESWLNEVKEKQLLCDQGLQHANWSRQYGLQQLPTSENDSRLPPQFDSRERQLAVNAAAASIYSTCSFLLSGS